MRVSALWLLLILFSLQLPLAAIELPVTFLWDSANSTSYTPQQEGKELAWNEFYRIGIKLESLQLNDLKMNLHLQSHADFIDSYIEIKQFELVYSRAAWGLTAVTKPIGYGMADQLNPHYLVSPAMAAYRYQDTRFNGLELAFHNPQNQIVLTSGGNMQNQAIASVAYEWQRSDQALNLGLKQSARTLDSHFRSPVFISSSTLGFASDTILLQSELALCNYPELKLTKAHSALYAYGECQIMPTNTTTLHLSAETRESEPSGVHNQQYQFSLSRQYNTVSLTPMGQVDFLKKEAYYRANLIGDWEPLTGQRIGLFYGVEGSSAKSLKHNFGIQAELRYGL